MNSSILIEKVSKSIGLIISESASQSFFYSLYWWFSCGCAEFYISVMGCKIRLIKCYEFYGESVSVDSVSTTIC